MSFVITGATGKLGRHVVETLLERGAAPADITATGRSVERIADLAERGVVVRSVSYDDTAALHDVIGAGDRVLLVSGSEPGARVAQHGNVIDAAKDAGAELVAYTSIVHADRVDIAMAEDHRATEALLAASGVPAALLRNDFYLEVYTGQAPDAAERGEILGAARDGRISAALRSELAEAAAIVLMDGAAGTFELGGDEAFTLDELASALSQATGRPVVYRNLGLDEYAAALVATGAPEPVARIMADVQRGIAEGQLDISERTLSELLGRPTTSLADALRQA